VRLVPSDSVELLRPLETGAVVWTDFDRYSTDETEKAASVCRQLVETRPGVSHFNNPATSLQRFDLLHTLHTNGTNSFNVYRLQDASLVRRYPVFIRRASGTTRLAPSLIGDADALNSALNAIPTSCDHRPDLMIVELGNAMGEDGYYRKYGAYRVGDRIYPQHVVLDRDWFAKFPTYRGNSAQKRAQSDYFDGRPDVDALMKIFTLARIEYGRMDYCIVDGGIEVFEINTNPSVLNNPPTRFDRFDYSLWANRHADALLSLDCATVEENLAPAWAQAIREKHEEVVAAIAGKLARRRARMTVRRAVSELLSGRLPGNGGGMGRKSKPPLTRSGD
jgi:hypothetical protein